ncbi:MAG: LysM peptidoglycan-binding domain-containing protein [Caldilineaceae bacterium]
MQEVVCFQCGRIVHISPDAELCSVCGENLRELLHPAHASKYFYDRAATLATGGDLLQALREVDRGLGYRDSSELRLLGAILSQRIGDFEQMRHHVAAVPVDDVLRQEAEWLLRSHQSRQREQRMASGRPNTKQLPPLENNPVESDPLPPFEEELPSAPAVSATAALVSRRQPNQLVSPPRGEQRGTKPKQSNALAYFSLAILILVSASIMLAASGVTLPFFPWSTPSSELTDSNINQELSAPVHQPNAETTQNAADPVLAATATPLPTLEVPEDLVQKQPEPIAESTPGSLLVNVLQPFDLKPYLLEVNRPDLAELDVAASSQEGTVRLDGIVPSFVARRDLLAVMAEAPGVSSVSGADLLVRLPPTYTVVAGDNLWAISYYLYGEDRVGELLEANADLLPSSDLLTIGMELKVPVVE